MYQMDHQLRADVLQRLEGDLGMRHIGGTNYMRKGECPACHKRELFTDHRAPWVLKCGRESKCGQTWHVKELYSDLFEDWSERFKPTSDAPAASADGYLQFARGFDLSLVKGWYSQENYWDRDQRIGSATVRFPLAKGGYWERLIDRPSRFGKQKARFQPGASYRGVWWCPPSLDLQEVKELWIVEGIFDAIALTHHGIAAVSAMSSNAYPEQSLKDLASARQGKLPKLVWALDNEPGAHRYTRRWARQARELGFKCEAAQIPQPGSRKVDWNDLHQRWAFEQDEAKREERRDQDLKEARYHGALLLADTAAEKAVLMYEWRERHEFHFTYEARLYWFKLDLDKYNKALTHIEESERDEDRELTTKQQRDKAMRLAGNVVEIANCAPQALYFQRNEVTDESWYYFRVEFPHDGAPVKNTFTGAQVAAASEFKKRLLSMAAGAVFTGSGTQLDKIMKDQLFGLKTVETMDYVGYSREHGCYVFGDLAVRDGQLHQVNDEDYFDFGKLRLKTLQKTIGLKPNPAAGDYRSDWLPLLWTCFGANGLTALTFWFGSLFAEQIRARYQSFPFLEATGEAGAGKTTLLTFLWKLFGRAGYEGFDPSKSSTAGRSRAMGQVAGMPIVLIEGDRNDPEKAHAKSFDWDELKDFFGGGTLRTRGMKTSGNETYEPPFRGTIAISQNAAVSASEAILTRIVKLHFTRPVLTDESRAAADTLSRMDGEALSHFLLQATRKEAEVLTRFHEVFPQYEAKLRRLGDTCFCCGARLSGDAHRCSSCQSDLVGHLRIERIVKNHAMFLALLDCLALVVDIPAGMVSQTQRTIVRIALERQAAISADNPVVTEFWQVYDYLQSLSENPVVNHSKNPAEVAINLNEFVERAAEHRQRLADMSTPRELLKDSRQFRYLDNKAVDSRIRELQRAAAPLDNRPSKVRCWVFTNPNYQPGDKAGTSKPTR